MENQPELLQDSTTAQASGTTTERTLNASRFTEAPEGAYTVSWDNTIGAFVYEPLPQFNTRGIRGS